MRPPSFPQASSQLLQSLNHSWCDQVTSVEPGTRLAPTPALEEMQEIVVEQRNSLQ